MDQKRGAGPLQLFTRDLVLKAGCYQSSINQPIPFSHMGRPIHIGHGHQSNYYGHEGHHRPVINH